MRIVNSCVGDDSTVGNYTYKSTLGCSLIDYIVFPCNLFPYTCISNFVVHDFQSCSSYTPIQLILNVYHIEDNNNNTSANTYSQCDNKGIKWKLKLAYDYYNLLFSQKHDVNSIIEKITCEELNLDMGVNELSDLICNCAFTIFGKKGSTGPCINSQKFKSLWFNGACEIVRPEFRFLCRAYKTCKSSRNREVMLTCRNNYRKVKRIAKGKYKNEEKHTLQNLSRESTQKFWSKIKKMRSRDVSPKADISSLYQHFKNLFYNDNSFMHPITEYCLNESDSETISVPALDHDFTPEEVASAINSLKKGKGAGFDNLLPEMFIECKTFMSPVLCTLFNFMYTNSLYPASWTKCIIVPVPKKGDLSDANNYRGITLTSIFSKIFSIMLDNRLRKWAEFNDIIHDCQYGFHQRHSAVDLIFILSSVVNKVIK